MQNAEYLSKIIERGKALYESGIKQRVEPDPLNRGKHLALDTRTGEWEIDTDMVLAVQRLRDRLPQAEPYTIRIGLPYAIRLGSGSALVTMPELPEKRG